MLNRPIPLYAPKPRIDAAPLDAMTGMINPYLNWLRDASTVNAADPVLMMVYV